MSHNFKSSSGPLISKAETERLRIAIGTYICDLLHVDAESLVNFALNKTPQEIAIELGWILGAMISAQSPENAEALAHGFENGRRLATVLVPVLTNQARIANQLPEVKADEPAPLFLPIPAPSCELTERPNLQFYLLKPSGETVQ